MGQREETDSNLGLQIVRTLVAELKGTFEIVSDGGTNAEVRIPAPLA
jgi:two-component sensor histidine kinase